MVGNRLFLSAIEIKDLTKWPDYLIDDYISIQNVTKTILPDGSIQPATIADADAQNNTIYYSSDQSKLVYKDSSGIVNDLY